MEEFKGLGKQLEDWTLNEGEYLVKRNIKITLNNLSLGPHPDVLTVEMIQKAMERALYNSGQPSPQTGVVSNTLIKAMGKDLKK
jgi:hypothetical protein